MTMAVFLMVLVPVMRLFFRLAPDRRHHHEKHYFRNEADDAAARSRHHEGNSHQSRDKQIEQTSLFVHDAGEEHTEWQCNREFHVAGEVVTINEWTKSSALAEFAHPIDFGRTGE